MWIPDVYQGAPTVVTLIIGSTPSLRPLPWRFPLVDGLPLAIDWQQMLAVLAIASIARGQHWPVLQTNLKRMLACSTISHMGFLFLGLLSGVVNGMVDANAAETATARPYFYIVTYVLTVLLAFGLMPCSHAKVSRKEIADLAGLNQRSPLYAAVMAGLHVLAGGHSTTGGFYAKLSVLRALVASGHKPACGPGGVAVVMSLIGAFYLRVVKVMYFDAPLTAGKVSAPFDARVVLSINGALGADSGRSSRWL